jgi:alkylation response protein AidB-like acyl-CoA dehydrogenase
VDFLRGITEEFRDFIDLAGSFSRKTILPMFEGDSPDGDLSRVETILRTAFETGLAASPDENMPGHEYGIWGVCPGGPGARLSVALLTVVAQACGGVAMSLHSQGLASSIVSSSGRRPVHPAKKVAAAIQDGYGFPGYRTLLDPAVDGPEAVQTIARSSCSGYAINGRKPFVYGMPGADAYVVFCRMEEGSRGWGCFLVPASARGLQVNSITGRTGLRACGLSDLELRKVEVPAEARLDDGDALAMVKKAVCTHWLGLSAIAAGNARGALQAARRYASERYQGGTTIENHAAVQKLIALSEARIETAYALLLNAADSLQEGNDGLRQCAIAKHMATDLCFRAVTDSLQVLGGYGYMEDYRMEKRLRDAAVLKSAGGSANALELFIFEAGKEA